MKTKINISILALLVILLIVPSGVSAQGNVSTLDECIRLAMENNLTMKSGRISIERAKDLQGTAFNIEKTGFSLSQDPTSGGSPDNSISLSQDFDFPTVYTTRSKLLKAETNLERSNLEVTRNELVKEITATYYQLLYAKENIKILQDQDNIYSKFLFLASTKFRVGETSRLEQMNAERLYNENKIELQKAEKDYQNIQLTLQRWMNAEVSVSPLESEQPVMEANYPFNSFSAEQTPIGRVMQNQKEVSEKNLNVVKQGYLPSFSFVLKNQFLIKGFNPYDVERERFDKGNFMGFEVGISIPLFFGEQKAKTKVAKKEVEMARVQQEEVAQAMQKQYQMYINDYLKAKNSLDYYTSQGITQADDITRISQISYEKGEIGYLEYIQNLKTAVEIHLQRAKAVNDYNQTIIMLNYIQGNK
ncbi:TolC family protein [Dysgonomonas macrotermitis]|uniref:Outer membrane protein TolC n=1 Tax=Dysgonomonas macrotermitis TaxID=1346286 RepID=A0A1M5BPB1_9BACT|nr:TolC family protein [Dysgonomonas macrotermitis]SHF44271.1 Outer membrane protein TolC [Dysgonomonas macrotermitis]